MPQYGKLKIDQFLYNDSGTDVTLDLANIASRGANTFTGNQSLGDNIKVQLGASNDLQIYHDGSNSWIKDTGTGSLYIDATDVFIRDSAGNENVANFRENGACNLYYNNAKKLETTSYGTLFTGNSKWVDNGKVTFGDSDDLQLFHDGSNSFIKEAGTGSLFIYADGTYLKNAAGNENLAAFVSNGTAELYYDNSKKAETVAAGFLISGELVTSQNAYSRITHQESGASKWSCGLRANGDDNYHLYRESGSGNVVIDNGNFSVSDNQKALFGAGDDLTIYSDGTNGVIHGQSSDLYIKGNSIYLQSNTNEASGYFKYNGSVELYYDGSKKLQTQTWGVQFYGTLHAVDSAHINLGDSNDLQIYHDGGSSFIKHDGQGHLYVYAAGTSEDLYLRAADNVHIETQTSDTAINAIGNGAVELYYDDAKKLETTSGGINVTGAITVNGAALAGGSSYAGLLKYF